MVLFCQQSGQDQANEALSGKPINESKRVEENGAATDQPVDLRIALEEDLLGDPFYSLHLADGEIVTIDDLSLENKAVLLYFFATW